MSHYKFRNEAEQGVVHFAVLSYRYGGSIPTLPNPVFPSNRSPMLHRQEVADQQNDQNDADQAAREDQ
jgi:hypothetical protein